MCNTDILFFPYFTKVYLDQSLVQFYCLSSYFEQLHLPKGISLCDEVRFREKEKKNRCNPFVNLRHSKERDHIE